MPGRLKLFISSPGDVPDERLRVGLVVDKLGQDFARYFELESYRWEYEPMLASGHFQDSIDPPSSCDIVVLIVWSRLGTPLPVRTAVREYRGIDDRAPVTGTEWEFEDALKAARARGTPDIVAFRNVSPMSVDSTDAGVRARSLAQLDALDAFWKRNFVDGGAFLAGFQTYRNVDQFASLFEQSLRKLIERRIRASSPDSAAAAASWLGAPFRGLQPYEFEHAAIFYGRDGLVAQALERLAARAREGTAFLLVCGASGSGKSSLVKAALVPRLMKPQRIEGAAFTRHALFRPGGGAQNLFLGLAEALTSGSDALSELLGPGQSASELATYLQASADSPAFAFANALGRVTASGRASGRLLAFEQARLILVIDQLEELFTDASLEREERETFALLLGGICRSGCVWVVATLRNDFVPRLAESPRLTELASPERRLEAPALSPAEVAEIIRKPALAAGLTFEVHPVSGLGLDVVLAEDASDDPGVLPLLSFTLDTLYRDDVVQAGGRMLTFATYEGLGGLDGAIAKRASEIVDALPQPARDALPRVLRALTTLSSGAGSVAAAQPAPLARFPAGGDGRVVVDALIAARLLVASDEGGVPTVRLAHEALISRWDRAREQLSRDRRDIETRTLVEAQHRRWRDAALAEQPLRLLRDPDLASALDLARRWGDELPTEIVEFIARSNRAARAKANRRRATVAVVMAGLVLLTLAAVASLAIVQRQRNDALIAQSRALIRDARSAVESGNAALAVRLALEALPRDLAHPNRPFLRDAANALADAYVNQREAADLVGHEKDVNAIAFSPDGARLATASEDGTARVWKVADARELFRVKHRGPVNAVAFSPDGSRLLTASSDHTAQLWDAASGAAIGAAMTHDSDLVSAAFSPDGARIVTASLDETAHVWDGRTGGDIVALPSHAGLVAAAVFAPDGKTVATASAQGDTQIWDTASGALARTLTQSHESVECLALSPDGRRLVAGADDGMARLWDTRTGALAHALAGHGGRIIAAVFSADGKRLATGAADNSARIWNVETGTLEHTLLGHGGPVYAVAFSPDGRRLATASEDRTARLWDVATGDPGATLGGHSGAVLGIAFSPSGKELVTASRDATARIWTVEAAAFIAELLGGGAGVVSAGFAADGSKAATVTADGVATIWATPDRGPPAILARLPPGARAVSFASDGARVVATAVNAPTRIFDASGSQQFAIGGSGDLTASFSPDGRLIVTVPLAGEPRLWDASSGADLGPATSGDGAADLAVFSPNGGSLFVARKMAPAAIVNVGAREPRVALDQYTSPIGTAAFSPDGTRVVTASIDGDARVWDASTGRSAAPPLHHDNVVESASFSRDGNRVVTASLDHSAAVWDARDGAKIARIPGHDNYTLWSAAFSPDGRSVVTSSDDQSARIWAAENGQWIATLEGHAGAVTRAEFSPDGKRILTASADGAARLWRAPPSCQALIDAARAHAHGLPDLTAGPLPPSSAGLLWLYERIEPLLAFLTPKAGETCP